MKTLFFAKVREKLRSFNFMEREQCESIFFGARWVGRPSTALLPWLSNARVANLKGTPQKEPFFFEGQVLVYWCSHRKIPSVFSIASTAQIGLSLNTNLVLHEIITFPKMPPWGKIPGTQKEKPCLFSRSKLWTAWPTASSPSRWRWWIWRALL